MTLDLARTRLATQRLVAPHFATPLDAVRALVAVQAQDHGAGMWAIAQRTKKPSRAAVERAFADRTIVRTWPMRGTLHVVAAEDLRWMTALLAPRVIKRSASRHRQLGLDNKVFAKSRTLLEKHLSGKTMTRPELFALLARAKIDPREQRGPHILGVLAMERVLCFGAHRGKQPTFALLDEWIPKSRALAGDEAVAELARRYFTSHGPATADDFAWWTGMNRTESRRAVELVQDELDSHTIGDVTYWHGKLAKPKGSLVHLLSAWDEYTVGYRDRAAILDPSHVTSTLNALAWVFTVDGRVAGVWKRETKRTGIAVTLAPFAPLERKTQRSADEAIARYQAYLAS